MDSEDETTTCSNAPSENSFGNNVEMQIVESNTALPTETSYKKRKKQDPSSCAGRWTPEEHKAFLVGLAVYGREWNRVAKDIPTRTSAQVRSHAQKYFAKIEKEKREDAWPGSQVSKQIDGAGQQPSFAASPESIARIIVSPEAVQQEVEDVLQKLHERYRQLQIKLVAKKLAVDRGDVESISRNSVAVVSEVSMDSIANDDESLSSTLSHLNRNEEELIAAQVLHSGLHLTLH
jgi:SHAQKYF class myb-like DNA-binding protein